MFRNRLYLAMVSGHFIVDVLNSLGAVLLAVLAVPLGLSNAQIGLTITVYLLAGSLSQPLFGMLNDRLPGRSALLAAIAILWMALMFSIVAFAQSWNMLLISFLLAALGSGLFHPVGTASAARLVPERANSATAGFFFCGQMGLASGPILGGLLIGRAEALGVLPLAMLALLPTGLLLLALHDERNLIRPAGAGKTARQAGQTAAQASVVLIAAFIVLVAMRSSIQATFQAFIPKLFADSGWQPELFGLLAGVYMGAGAIGNVVMGNMADRFGMRTATVVPMLLSVPAGILTIASPGLLATFIGAALAGFLVGGQHSVLVVHAQRLLPTGKGLAAGLILGFTFGAGAFGTWLVGLSADFFSLPAVMQAMTWLGLPVALLALTLPGRRAAAPPASSEPAPATGD